MVDWRETKFHARIRLSQLPVTRQSPRRWQSDVMLPRLPAQSVLAGMVTVINCLALLVLFVPGSITLFLRLDNQEPLSNDQHT